MRSTGVGIRISPCWPSLLKSSQLSDCTITWAPKVGRIIAPTPQEIAQEALLFHILLGVQVTDMGPMHEVMLGKTFCKSWFEGLDWCVGGFAGFGLARVPFRDPKV